MVEWQRLRIVVAGAALFCARDAAAQGAAQPGAPAAPQYAGPRDIAEQRFHAGNCAGAIDAFDAALRNDSMNPELRRDRGACHEKLGQPFPAIDDYRFYVVHRPDAADAEAIRAKITDLETQVGIVKQGQADVSSQTGAEVSTSIGGETDASASAGGKGGLATLETNQQLESQANSSPLRRGSGFILGLGIGGRDFTSSSFGAGELVGIDLRYSFLKVSTILLELSLSHVAGPNTPSSLGGPGIMGGYELRIPFNSRVSDALLLGATFRYESLSQSNGSVFSMLEPEGFVGYRHVFGYGFGLEAAADAGPAFSSINGVANSSTTQALIGGHFGVLLGF
jgi:hypothetical protein